MAGRAEVAEVDLRDETSSVAVVPGRPAGKFDAAARVVGEAAADEQRVDDRPDPEFPISGVLGRRLDSI